MAKGGLEDAVNRFNSALTLLGDAAGSVRAGGGTPQALGAELERLREQRTRLTQELELVKTERSRDAERREDILRRLDDSIAELRHILGQ